ncbi:TonB-dependent receptor [Mucilaginibacter lappiensis]|uniref:TonB-linked SusC/RagA family outer membrane protein n=1 Tax=Mucilaginibacter lappiensis TaxID=354630 RepID=A0A841JBS5_9SPHI|nr:TonB-dependent receptor [Mucilaginibacter lappiensis]MBB6126038.1 TonB-linked SusC/RagA family outer membrane protein [Mucilaginibacter lappiensis]
MKITSLILLLAFMQVSASVFSQKITYKQNDVTLKQLFSEINRQTGYNVFWSPKGSQKTYTLDVNFKNTPLDDVLKTALKNLQLSYIIDGKSIIITKEAAGVEAFSTNTSILADITVTGSVKDSKGVPLTGVSISVVGNFKQGTVTDINGKFILDVKEGATIKITFVGFKSQTFIVTPQTKLFNVTLEEDVQQADEVVVTAYGKKERREAIVGSVTTVKPGNLKIPASNLTNALAGQVAGVIAYQPSGQPGVDNSTFFIRGVTTFGYRQSPLILIDNVELTASDLARLNVDDIESFSILKDASATALYGARGGNGVILVKTKEGKTGKSQINFRVENASSQSVKTLQLADPITYMKLFNEAVRTRYPLDPLPYDQNKILNTEATINHAPGSNQYVYPAVNWLDMLFKNRTSTQRGNLSVQGGGGVARYYVAGSYDNDNGILRTDIRNNNNNNVKFQNYQIRSNVNINITDKTELIVRLAGTFNEYNGPRTNDANFQTDLYNLVMHTSPVDFPAYFPPDSANLRTKHILFGNTAASNGGLGSTQYINPYASLLSGHQNFSESRMLAQLELNQNLDFLTSGLNFHGIFSTNRYAYFRSQLYYNPFYYTTQNYDKTTNQYTLLWINSQPGQAQEYLSYSRDPYSDNLQTFVYFQGVLDYNRSIGKNNNVSASLIGTRQQQLYSNNIDPRTNTYSLQYSLPYRNLTVAGRATYSYKSRYFLEFNFGYNGSERFSANHRFGFFPTIGASWIISDEKFWGDLYDVFDRFKLRASYGLVGNDQIGSQRFFYLSDVNLNGGNSASFGTNNAYSHNGVRINSYENDDVTWETSKQTNLGLEFTLFKKFNVIAEIYRNDKYNILQDRSSIPSTMGLESGISANVGKVQSQGIDISVDGKQSLTKDIWLSARGNFTYSTNKYTQYEQPDYKEGYRNIIGQPLNRAYGYIAERLFVDDNEAKNSPSQIFSTGGTPPQGGDIKYRDLNGDGKIDAADQTFIGYPTVPQIVYGFGISTGFKNFDLSAFFQGQANVSFFIDPARTAPFIKSPDSYFTGNTALLKAYADDHWSEDNQNLYALYPRLGPNGGVIENNRQNSTWWLRDGSFMRLKSLEIGYTLPARLLKALSLKNARIYFNGLNLLTWSPFKLWDPEQGGNAFAYPVQKVFNVGLNINL